MPRAAPGACVRYHAPVTAHEIRLTDLTGCGG